MYDEAMKIISSPLYEALAEAGEEEECGLVEFTNIGIIYP